MSIRVIATDPGGEFETRIAVLGTVEDAAEIAALAAKAPAGLEVWVEHSDSRRVIAERAVQLLDVEAALVEAVEAKVAAKLAREKKVEEKPPDPQLDLAMAVEP